MVSLEVKTCQEEIPEEFVDFHGVRELLLNHSASGILIGGKAYGFMIGAHPVEIEKRKDTDVLVINGGEGISHEESDCDLFLPQPDGTFCNRNDFHLDYHIHYVGTRSLQPGLYLPPWQAVFLTEQEMATRRAMDRALPGILSHGFKTVPTDFKMLKPNDIILEFPGDFSWFGKVRTPFPLHLEIRVTQDGGRRTFVSFADRRPRFIPPTVFPTGKDVRTPEAGGSDFFPKVELSPEDRKKIALDQIKSGFVTEGSEYLLSHVPEEADSYKILVAIFRGGEKYPLQCANAIGLWLRTAEQKHFTSLFNLKKRREGIPPCIPDHSVDFSRYLGQLADYINEQFGPRYLDLAERLKSFDVDSLLPDSFSESVELCKPQLKQQLKEAIRFSFNNGPSGCAVGNLEFNINAMMDNGSREEDRFFFDKTIYDLCDLVGITEEEVVDLVDPNTALTTQHVSDVRFNCHSTVCLFKRRLLRKNSLTFGQIVRAKLPADFDEVYRLAWCVSHGGFSISGDSGISDFDFLVSIFSRMPKDQVRSKLFLEREWTEFDRRFIRIALRT